ncbi:uncharacterized protein FOMMEDRAFT_171327 [Fomitiporia mediterranea MF3/22]|uniref:uncharacterized protein n=1 Tax=Fomitiporia mediterranea (strain MF3/22) TaxID=694068 RepID=UPI00044091B5|nr:uncharacterized protein FOMMEDRAFT_171327 [Fomitiporia mediterranea MF3/22]EJC97935.1 hypothetical protein FOMMEDRAFT_171327 [Fomitiporia mediterranea MF3/22]
MLPFSPSEASKNPRQVAPKGDKHPIVELLPVEVIEYIFETGTRAEGADKGWDGVRNDKHGLNRPRKSLFPVRVSHVCRRWRRIAIDVPSLWTRLDFMEPRPFEKSKVWLERSKRAPLDLSIDLYTVEDGIDVDDTDSQYDDTDSWDDDIDSWDDDNQGYQCRNDLAVQDIDCILDLIIPHVSRWRTFRLSMRFYKHAYSTLIRLGKCPADPGAPILQAFALYYNNSGSSSRFPNLEHKLPFGGHAPMLTQAVFHGIDIDWKLLIPPSERSAISSLYSIPTFTTNLTDLDFNYHSGDVRPSYEEFITILRCAPNLASLKFHCSSPAPRQQGLVAQPIFLPNLRYLRLREIEKEDACALLRMFYAPVLKSISLSLGEEVYDAFIRQLAAPMPLPDPQSPGFRDLIFLPSSSGDVPDSLSLSEEGEEAGRFVDSRELKSILHNVTEVNLTCITCSTDSPQRFYSACHNLKRLSLDMICIPLEFFSVFMKDHAIPGCQGGGSNASLSLSSTTSSVDLMTQPGTPLCKHLESLSITGISGKQLIAFVKKRKAQGIPLQELHYCLTWKDIATTTEKERRLLKRWLIANVRSVKIVGLRLKGG